MLSLPRQPPSRAPSLFPWRAPRRRIEARPRARRCTAGGCHVGRALRTPTARAGNQAVSSGLRVLCADQGPHWHWHRRRVMALMADREHAVPAPVPQPAAARAGPTAAAALPLPDGCGASARRRAARAQAPAAIQVLKARDTQARRRRAPRRTTVRASGVFPGGVCFAVAA